MPKATFDDVKHQRERIRGWDDAPEEDRENLLECSKVMGRHQTGKNGWSHTRHRDVLKRLILLGFGGDKYAPEEMHDTMLSAALADKEAAGEMVEWINATYDNEETNRDMRAALRTFGKVLTNDDPTGKDATPPPSIGWVPASTPDTYDPAPNPAHMITWTETKQMCDHRGTNARNAALIAVGWDAGLRSGELQALRVGDVTDHQHGRNIHVRDGKTGTRDVSVTNAVPYLRQWRNQHPAPNDDDAPLWSKLKRPETVSYRTFLDAFKDAAEREGLDKPATPSNFRKSSASALASNPNISQRDLEKRYGWERGSSVAGRYIAVFGEEHDRNIAKARGVPVDTEEPEPTGPVPCERCDALMSRGDDECGNCGFIKDRAKAQEQIATGGVEVGSMIQEAVKEEMRKRKGYFETITIDGQQFDADDVQDALGGVTDDET